MSEPKHRPIGRYIRWRTLPFLGNVVREFDQGIGNVGLQLASQKILERTCSRSETQGIDKPAREILIDSPVVLVANHLVDIEPLPLLASLPPRRDVFIIGTVGLLDAIGSNFDRQYIPVYLRRSVIAKSGKLTAKMGCMLGLNHGLDDSQAHQRNIENVTEAGRRVKEGGMVILFPEGPVPGADWGAGLGHLLKDLNGTRDGYLVMAHIAGTCSFDPLRFLIPGGGRFLPPFTTSFSKPQKIETILSKNLDPKGIVGDLQGQYERWTERF